MPFNRPSKGLGDKEKGGADVRLPAVTGGWSLIAWRCQLLYIPQLEWHAFTQVIGDPSMPRL
jgi:hypothetical protein